MTAIELDGVTKRYGDVTALEDVDLTVEDGEIFGFLGPNGAGKSTTINILLDFVRPSSGDARVLGYDVREGSQRIRDRTGFLPEGYDVYERLSGRKHVEFVIDSKDADDDPMVLLDRVGLDAEDAQRKAGDYSKGMQQRLVLAMALVDQPDLLILDEPSTGLDPNGARRMREIIREEAERGATVFFSSHILGQVEAVCDTVGILQDGQVIAKDSVEGLRDAADTGTTLVVTVEGPLDAAVDAARPLGPVSTVATEGEDRLRITCDGDAKMTVLSALEEAGVEVSDFETEEASLDDVFAAYVDRQEVEA
ncbi:ABC transporter ATP-binding protein [Halomicrobium salinisoli]|uniref:ABC transporter ATP-binding protein n=1 Tax=Halomicrobium salinisoli TaxID=2878391 RepID=UPI001CEFDA12|nr:ABC transporter ATP-binding protein [Halomicrobium salinisoli]